MDVTEPVSKNLEDSAAALDCLLIAGSRHDRHRIEVQYGFDGLERQSEHSFLYDVDFVLFLPKSFGLLEAEDTGEIRQDFQSHVRLHTNSSDPKDEESAQRVTARLKNLTANPTIDEIRIFAIEFEGFIQALTKRSRKEMERVLRGEDLLPAVVAEIEIVAEMVKEFRKVLESRNLYQKRAADILAGSVDHDLVLLNEYLSHHYVQFLVGLEFSARMLPQTELICARLRELESEEYTFRQNHHFLIEERSGPQSSREEDLYLRRISLLKKYFHKPLYVQTSGANLQRRLLIPVYALSAAMAASFMIIVQIYQHQSLADRVGINSVALIALGIMAYAAKDIMKEMARRYLYRTGNRWFPDYEKKLFLEDEGGQGRIPFGVIKEYLRVLTPDQIPQQLKNARYSHFGGEVEESLYEDVLHFRKRVELDFSKLGKSMEFPYGLREILRYRFDRFLPSMEDAFKNLYLVSKAGIGSSRQGHRVYHVYMACWIHKREGFLFQKSQTPEAMKPAFKAYRITLDKTGILACDSVKWEEKFGMLPIP